MNSVVGCCEVEGHLEHMQIQDGGKGKAKSGGGGGEHKNTEQSHAEEEKEEEKTFRAGRFNGQGSMEKGLLTGQHVWGNL